MKLLVTGGTVFVSKYVAEYFAKLGNQVTVLNRNTRKQVEGVELIQADRSALTGKLKGRKFDAVLDITSYTAEDVKSILDSGVEFEQYILLSSSAVYPDTEPQPFTEESKTGENRFWGAYGTDKIKAEQTLLERVSHAYILRPPYLYGIYDDIYREAFVFDCAIHDRVFYLPSNGELKLQFFDVEDLCRFIDILLKKKPEQHILNVGNKEQVSIKEWVSLCYAAAGKKATFAVMDETINQRNYFCFSNYEYVLDISKQEELMPNTKPLAKGLAEAYQWYRNQVGEVEKRPYITFIDETLYK